MKQHANPLYPQTLGDHLSLLILGNQEYWTHPVFPFLQVAPADPFKLNAATIRSVIICIQIS